MNGLYLYGVGVPLALWLAALACVLWLAARFGGRRFVWTMSGLAAAIVVVLVVDGLTGCPAPDQNASAGCAPLGPLLYLTFYVTAPLALLGQAILTWWMLDYARQD